MNGRAPDKMDAHVPLDAGELLEFMSRRRSCKKFRNEQIPRETLLEIASAASFAPSQNKNIKIVIVDDPELIRRIDCAAMKTVRRWYGLLFSVKPLTKFYMLFSSSLSVIKAKMERDLFLKKRIVKENAACLFVLVGDARVPVTEPSAQYLLANMILCAEALGVGTCLMDSVKLSVNQNAKLKRELGIPRRWKALGVMAAGYSGENVVNIPRESKAAESCSLEAPVLPAIMVMKAAPASFPEFTEPLERVVVRAEGRHHRVQVCFKLLCEPKHLGDILLRHTLEHLAHQAFGRAGGLLGHRTPRVRQANVHNALVLLVRLSADEPHLLQADEYFRQRRRPHVHLFSQVALDDAVILHDQAQQPVLPPVMPVVVQLTVGNAELQAPQAVQFRVKFYGILACHDDHSKFILLGS
jgi:nitroreductase